MTERGVGPPSAPSGRGPSPASPSSSSTKSLPPEGKGEKEGEALCHFVCGWEMPQRHVAGLAGRGTGPAVAVGGHTATILPTFCLKAGTGKRNRQAVGSPVKGFYLKRSKRTTAHMHVDVYVESRFKEWGAYGCGCGYGYGCG